MKKYAEQFRCCQKLAGVVVVDEKKGIMRGEQSRESLRSPPPLNCNIIKM